MFDVIELVAALTLWADNPVCAWLIDGQIIAWWLP